MNKLTRAGEIVYSGCQDIIERYETMMKDISRESLILSGQITIGIPPLVLSFGYARMINNFRNKYPNIVLKIIEEGAEELYRIFNEKDIDYAILVMPLRINLKNAETHMLAKDNLVDLPLIVFHSQY